MNVAALVWWSEVDGKWNSETAQFLTALARARAQEVPLILQGRVAAASVRRWNAMGATFLGAHFFGLQKTVLGF